MTEVDDQLKLLEESSLKLNEESNSINSLIEKVEKRLAAAKPGISCDVQLDGESTLEFTKFGDEWRLVVIFDADPDDGRPEETFSLLSNCSRDLRIKALKELPSLIMALRLKVQDALATIDRARAEYDK